jgi:hypothetical protein
MAEPIITFKNPAIVDWLHHKGIKGKYIDYVTPQDIAHKHVFGHIPMWLAVFADKISEISVPGLTPPERERFNKGQITVQELDKAGAYVATYQVRPVN